MINTQAYYKYEINNRREKFYSTGPLSLSLSPFGLSRKLFGNLESVWIRQPSYTDLIYITRPPPPGLSYKTLFFVKARNFNILIFFQVYKDLRPNLINNIEFLWFSMYSQKRIKLWCFRVCVSLSQVVAKLQPSSFLCSPQKFGGSIYKTLFARN